MTILPKKAAQPVGTRRATRHPKSLKTMKPDGQTPDNRPACTRDTTTNFPKTRARLSHGRAMQMRVGPSGAPIGTGFARRDTRLVTRRAVGSRARLSSPTHTHEKTGMENEKKPLRQAMPTVAGWIDELRAAFGAQAIDAAIRSGLDGQPTFHAREAGHEVGTPIPYDPAKAVSVATLIEIGHLATAKAKDTPKGRRHG